MRANKCTQCVCVIKLMFAFIYFKVVFISTFLKIRLSLLIYVVESQALFQLNKIKYRKSSRYIAVSDRNSSLLLNGFEILAFPVFKGES